MGIEIHPLEGPVECPCGECAEDDGQRGDLGWHDVMMISYLLLVTLLVLSVLMIDQEKK